MSQPPHFRFYPGAYDDEVIKPSEAACGVCQEPRGWVCESALYGVAPPENPCPWCIADGRAGVLADCEFGACNEVGDGVADEDVREEIANRTPKPPSWQDFIWPVHAGTPMIYEGRKEYEDVKDHPAQLTAMRAAVPDEETMLKWVSRDGDVNVMMFRSMNGAAYFGWMDCS